MISIATVHIVWEQGSIVSELLDWINTDNGLPAQVPKVRAVTGLCFILIESLLGIITKPRELQYLAMSQQICSKMERFKFNLNSFISIFDHI